MMANKTLEIKNTEYYFSKRLKELIDAYGTQDKFTEDFNRYLLDNNITETKKGITTVLSITTASISNYVNRKGMPSSLLFKSMADFFGVSYDYLFGSSTCKERENINASKELGLSEYAIESLKQLAFSNNVAIGFINHFLSDPLFMDLGNDDSIASQLIFKAIYIHRKTLLLDAINNIEIPQKPEEDSLPTEEQDDPIIQKLSNVNNETERVLNKWIDEMSTNSVLETLEIEKSFSKSRLIESVKEYFGNCLDSFIDNIDGQYEHLPELKHIIGIEDMANLKRTQFFKYIDEQINKDKEKE